jgi:Bacterial alpha-L-rhamnosidase 6 hairpin glycosidase domain/Bacterial alpha-L-rhamnosidase C-terminal domain
VPASLIGAAHGKSATKLRITFRNSDDPGSGAQIASVWALSSAGHPQPPYGGSVSNAAKATTATGMTLSSHIFGRPYAIFDFGHEVGGRVQATLKNSGPAMTVGLAFSEAPIYMTTASDFSEDSPGVATETHYITVPHGTTTFEDPVIRGGFRYLMVFADSPGTVHVSKLRVHFTASPDAKNLRSYKGAFLSSDSALNKLWYEAAYTLQMDTINPNTGRSYPAAPGEVQNNAKIAQGTTAIVDGAKRDRMDWVGDQSVEDPVAYMTTDDTRSVYNSFAFMGKGAAADGQVPGIFLPGSGYNDGWGEYAAWWVQEFWNYYLYTGSTSFLTQWFPTVEKDMAWFQSQVDSNGLVNTGSGGTWGYGLNGEQTYLNTLYVLILGDAASAATAQGDTALATQYQTEASSVTSAINSKLWDSTTGAYIAAPGNTAHPQDANVMAVLSGVAAQGGNESSVFSFLRTQWTPYGPLDIDQPNSFVNQYVSPFVTYYELLAYAGQNSQTTTDQAMDLLDRTWSPMEKAGYPGTMWENVSLSGDPQLGAYTSLSHGWSAGVVPFLTNELLGVNPTAGGFSQFTVLPHPPQGMSWAKGAIPTPHGPISTSWKQTDSGNDLAVFVKAPKGTTYSVGVPDSASTVKANGSVIWSGGVAQVSGVADVNGYITLSNATGDTTIEGSGN